MTKRAGMLSAVAVLTVLGCDNATGPEPEVDRRFILFQVNDLEMPATIEEAPGRFRTFVVDIIRFYDDETWDRYQEQTLREEGRPDQQIIWESDGTIVRNGDEVTLDRVCDDTPTASCVAPDRLRITPEGAVIEYAFGGEEGLTLHYLPLLDDTFE